MGRSSIKTVVWILPDQLLRDHPALIQAEQEDERDAILVAMVESHERLHRLPYHRKRQVLQLSAGRHYAQMLRDRGYRVALIEANDDAEGLERAITDHKPLRLLTMAASEYDTRQQQEWRLQRALDLAVDILPNTMMIVGRHDPIPDPDPDRKYMMETFYRRMRKHFNVLMETEKDPVGGRWNFDADNRKPLPDSITPPDPFGFEPDATTRQAIDQAAENSEWIGQVDGFDLAVTHEQAERAFDDFLEQRLCEFGPFEDAMSSRHPTLYHSVLSPYMNLGLLEPLEMVRRAEQAYHDGRAPINSVEGFIRQILGWREFMYWQYWHQMPELRGANSWQALKPMPKLFWDGRTDLNCLGTVVGRLLETGYAHHIERLMVVSNFCLLAGVDPAAVADWFLAFYIDSHDWVVLPNVIGMGLNADDGRTATKPYIASANYINKMSDYCKTCRFDPKQRLGDRACPFNALYWNFLIEHEETLRGNPRLGPAVLGLGRIDQDQRDAIREQANRFLESLAGYRKKLATAQGARKLDARSVAKVDPKSRRTQARTGTTRRSASKSRAKSS